MPEKIVTGTRRLRPIATEFRAAKDASSGELYIEGYFAVFSGTYELWPGATESIDPHAFDETVGDDIRFLTDHDTTLVLGRTQRSKTGEVKVDTHGLWGRCKINQADQDALNLYARVERGDVDQASFGFDIVDEMVEYREDGSIHWTLKKVKLWEVSVCTFPAYDETEINVASRRQDFNGLQQRRLEEWKLRMKERLRKHGNSSAHAG